MTGFSDVADQKIRQADVLITDLEALHFSCIQERNKTVIGSSEYVGCIRRLFDLDKAIREAKSMRARWLLARVTRRFVHTVRPRSDNKSGTRK